MTSKADFLRRKTRRPSDTNVLEMQKFELVIVGGGLTTARAIKEYRATGGGGRIALLTRERTLPYHRPPLSKRYLRGESTAEQTLVEPQEFYDEHEVELLLGNEVTAVDTRREAVSMSDGARLGYRKLLLATGAIPRSLDVAGADLPGVFALRSLENATAIRESAAQTRDAVVVGSGFIGMEVAASLTELGLDVSLVSRDTDLFAQLRSPEISEHLVKLYRERGVEIIRGDQVAAFRGRSRLDTVELHTGRELGAGLAVVGVGVQPAVSFLEGSGIATDDGILVDERFRTNLPNVYAAGDVARFYDPLFGRSRRIEHWSNANYQGAEVGKVLAGADGGYDTVSTFFTESFGLTLKVFGDVSQHDDRVARGSFAHGDAIVFYFERGRLVGTLHTGQTDETEAELKRLIGTRARAESFAVQHQ
ncbi:MAG: NAD(P)/FAD-dependent oxidoreductase [Actinobacteria bacterium]|nr:MAG: NAD(P)/FAD-dependent oxidoreductase [Actinomycetota bacterium]